MQKKYMNIFKCFVYLAGVSAVAGCSVFRDVLLDREDTIPPGTEPIKFEAWRSAAQLTRSPVDETRVDLARGAEIFSHRPIVKKHMESMLVIASELRSILNDPAVHSIPTDVPNFPTDDEYTKIVKTVNAQDFTSWQQSLTSSSEKALFVKATSRQNTVTTTQTPVLLNSSLNNEYETLFTDDEKDCRLETCETAEEFLNRTQLNLTEMRASQTALENLRLHNLYSRGLQKTNDTVTLFQFHLQCASAVLRRSNTNTVHNITWPRMVIHESGIFGNENRRTALIRNQLALDETDPSSQPFAPLQYSFTELRTNYSVRTTLRKFLLDGAASRDSHFHSQDNYANQNPDTGKYRNHLSRFAGLQVTPKLATHSFASYQVPLNRITLEGTSTRTNFGGILPLSEQQKLDYANIETQITTDAWTSFTPVSAFDRNNNPVALQPLIGKDKMTSDFGIDGLHFVDPTRIDERYIPRDEDKTVALNEFFALGLSAAEASKAVEDGLSVLQGVCDSAFEGAQ